MNALHQQFVAESRELIHQAIDDLIAMEHEGFAAARIERVFRAFHTLKGSAGVVELPAMEMALHAAEDLLAAIQSGRIAATQVIVNQALDCLDQVSRWVDEFEARGVLSPRADDDARSLMSALRSHLSANAARANPRAQNGKLPDWAMRLIGSRREAVTRQPGDMPTGLMAIAYTPREGCFFDGDDPLGLVRQVPNLLAIHVELDRRGPLADFDPFTCQIRIHALAAGERHVVSSVFRLVPDQVQIVDVPPGTFETHAGDRDPLALLRTVLEEQREVLRLTVARDDLAGRIGACGRAAANALRHVGRPELADQIAAAAASASAAANTDPLQEAIAEILGLLKPAGSLAPVTGRPDQAPAGDAGRWLRIDEARIDALVNLAGELIVFKNSFAHLAQRTEDESGGELARTMKRERDAIDRLTTDLQEAILQLRMVPVAQVLRPFSRLVRDLSQQLKKNVRLVTQGETTELDKAVVDRLFEPLLHLVRNALDHGIEPPDERRAAGKPESATLTIQASRLGDRIVLEVADDGRGIDPALIRRKARERELLPPDQLAALSDEDVLKLIFSIGLSTAAQVSEISGRGIGMDVVQATIDQIGGRVSVSSRVGAGTTVRLDVPVSIATSRIMVVECGDQAFGIPMDAVRETVRVPSDQVREVKTNEGFVLHDRVVPICSLAELMNLPYERQRTDSRLVMIVETAGKLTAVEIDAIRQQLDVVLKPMQGLLAGARGFAGTTLLGDGTVLLVLDLKEILP